MKGFLGTWASFTADLNLLIQIAMGLALLGDAVLARTKRYTAHGVCQAAVLILNLPMIALVMWPSLHTRVLPRLPSHLLKRTYVIAALHGVLGRWLSFSGFTSCWSSEQISFPVRGAFIAGSCGCGSS